MSARSAALLPGHGGRKLHACLPRLLHIAGKNARDLVGLVQRHVEDQVGRAMSCNRQRLLMNRVAFH